MRMDENRFESTSKSCNAVCLLFSILAFLPHRRLFNNNNNNNNNNNVNPQQAD